MLESVDTEIKVRIFENMEVVIQLENVLKNIFSERCKANTLLALKMGTIVKNSQLNIFKAIKEDINLLLADNQ